jgi:hypothetical protein
MYRWRIKWQRELQLAWQSAAAAVCLHDGCDADVTRVAYCILRCLLVGGFTLLALKFDFYLAFKVYCNVGQRCPQQTCSCFFVNIACIALASAL